MTKDADFKRLVRQQMAITGQSYTAARAAIYRPATGLELPLARRVLGLNTAYKVGFFSGGAPGGVSGGEYLFHRVVGWGRSTDVFLANGARVHLRPDEASVAQPAYATPECDSIVELVAAERAGDEIIVHLAGVAEERLGGEGSPATLSVARVEGGQSESYLVPASVPGDRYLGVLEPFLATRWVCGAAVAGSVPQATLSVPAIADDTKYRRLKIAGADPDLSQLATFLRVAATEQILRLVESGTAVHLDHRRDTPAIDAVRTQRAYLAAARQAGQRRGEDDVVLEAWQAALDSHEDTQDASPGTSDWYLRESIAAPITDLRPVSPGQTILGETTTSIVAPAQIEEAVDRPPQTTRARLRGEFIRRAKERRRHYTVDWMHLKLNEQAPRTVLCNNPLEARDHRAEQLIASL